MSDKIVIVVSGKVHQLTVMNTSKEDGGEYAFICGSDRVSATLTVNRKSAQTALDLQLLIKLKEPEHHQRNPRWRRRLGRARKGCGLKQSLENLESEHRKGSVIFEWNHPRKEVSVSLNCSQGPGFMKQLSLQSISVPDFIGALTENRHLLLCHCRTCCYPAIIITKPLQDLHAQEKDTVTFEVNINYDQISYRWLKNGVEIRHTDRCQARCKQLTHTLSIRNVHFGDSATYSFIAGSAVSQARLGVEG